MLYVLISNQHVVNLVNLCCVWTSPDHMIHAHMCTCSSVSSLMVTCFLLDSLPADLTPRCVSSSSRFKSFHLGCECVWLLNGPQGCGTGMSDNQNSQTGFLDFYQKLLRGCRWRGVANTHTRRLTGVRWNRIVGSHRRLSWNISNLMFLIRVCAHVPFVFHSDPGSGASLEWPLFPKSLCFLW